MTCEFGELFVRNSATTARIRHMEVTDKDMHFPLLHSRLPQPETRCIRGFLHRSGPQPRGRRWKCASFGVFTLAKLFTFRCPSFPKCMVRKSPLQSVLQLPSSEIDCKTIQFGASKILE